MSRRATEGHPPAPSRALRRAGVALALLSALGVGGCVLGEGWGARALQERLAASDGLRVGSVAPLREGRRVGLRLSDLRGEGGWALPELTLWAAPWAPATVHATLPERMTLPLAAPAPLTARAPEATLRVSPFSGLALAETTARLEAATLGGAALADRVALRFGAGAEGVPVPEGAAPYRLDLTLARLRLAPLLTAAGAVAPGGDLAQPLSVEGAAGVGLSAPLAPGSGGGPVRLTGLTSDGVTLRLGARTARLAARIAADAEGRARGTAVFDTDDLKGLLTLAAEAGAIPPGAVTLAGTMLTGGPAPAETPDWVPPPAPGQQRVMLVLSEGRMRLGALPLGPAPLMPVLGGAAE